MIDPTPAEILALPIGPPGRWRSTVRDYLIKFDVLLRNSAPGSRPFGNSGWRGDIDKAFIEAGWVNGKLSDWDGVPSVDEVDAEAVDRLVRSAIQGSRPSKNTRRKTIVTHLSIHRGVGCTGFNIICDLAGLYGYVAAVLQSAHG